MSYILLVEDDPILGNSIRLNLQLEHYNVKWATNVRNALEHYTAAIPQLLILDIGLPDGNGIDLCKEIRKFNANIPIIILTAQVDENTAVTCLNCGADDFIRKPFGNRELLARIKRLTQSNTNEILIGELKILKQQRKVFINTNEVTLNRRQYDILFHLAGQLDNIINREYLIQVLGCEKDINDRTIDSHICQLRGKLNRAGLKTLKISSVYGEGYRLEKNVKALLI